MKKTIIFILFICLLTIPFISCKSDIDANKVNTLTLDINSLNFKNEKSSSNIKVTTNMDESEWSAIVDDSGKSWCTTSCNPIDDKSYYLSINVSENNSKEIRETQVTISGKNIESKTIQIKQLGYEITILLSKDNFVIDQIGGKISFDITTNVKNLSITQDNWILENKESSTKSDMVTSNHIFSVKTNKNDDNRSGKITIKDKDSDVSTSVTISQKGMKEYESGSLEGIKDDIKVKISRGEATSEQNGEGIEKSFDGDYSTIYHSKWDNSPSDYFPITLTYYFDTPSAIDYMVYYPRQNGSNGFFKETEILGQLEGSTNFVKILDKDFKGSASATKVKFDNSLTKAGEIKKYNAIRIIVKSGYGDKKGFASCSEMEFYVNNPDKYNPLELFTDITCSELKSGVTEQDIEKCEYPLYKKIAYFMLLNKYPKEFRIAEFKAYPSPETQSSINKTNPYSLLDNPTGISVEKDEDLVVFAKGLNDRSISIKIQDLESGYGGTSYPLSDGFNRFKVANKGLIYVMYHTSDFETAQPIKLHFASGRINGYFDKLKHTKADWKRLLDGATNKYFDVLGQYSHLTFPLNKFKNNTPDGLELINAYDELVKLEMDFMGLFKYNKVFKNRMYFHVVYGDAYMYATAYRTAYHENTLDDLCNVSKLKSSSVWGPAHEVGHCNQTRPGLLWVGTTEVTNNIYSLYVQTKFGGKSRIQAEKIGNDFNNRYEKAMNNLMLKGIPHGNEEDVFCKLVPFWQIQLYIDNVCGNHDFYKDILEDIRTSGNIASHGQNQIDFVKRACISAKLDLTDFFTKWGFLTVIDKDIDDYGVKRLTVTQDMINKIKDEIKKLNLPKPDAVIEYITDNNANIYKNKQSISQGSASRNGNTITMTNWKNVVAYEVYQGEKLIFVSPEESFKINTNFDSSITIKAVSYNGKKVNVDLK